jgi:hypothetical protein
VADPQGISNGLKSARICKASTWPIFRYLPLPAVMTKKLWAGEGPSGMLQRYGLLVLNHVLTFSCF